MSATSPSDSGLSSLAQPPSSLQTFLRGKVRRPLLMGIVNAAPDSFYSGGRASVPEKAVETGLRLIEEGADILDVGGESTRPGADPVSLREELSRVLPVVSALAGRGVPLSVDTSKAEVALRALQAGAGWINDVSALRADPLMAEGVAEAGCPVVLMHRQGDSSKTMQLNPSYGDVVEEIAGFLSERLEFFESRGGDRRQAVLDPGIGFGKDLDHNLKILAELGKFRFLGCPVLLGASRKSFIGRILEEAGPAGPLPPEERLEGSLAVSCWAALCGVEILRVHDVSATRKALIVWQRVMETNGKTFRN